VQNIVSKTEPS